MRLALSRTAGSPRRNFAARAADRPLADELRAATADLPTLLRYLGPSESEPELVEASTQVLADLDLQG